MGRKHALFASIFRVAELPLDTRTSKNKASPCKLELYCTPGFGVFYYLDGLHCWVKKDEF